jgi:hypothetical protein
MQMELTAVQSIQRRHQLCYEGNFRVTFSLLIVELDFRTRKKHAFSFVYESFVTE